LTGIILAILVASWAGAVAAQERQSIMLATGGPGGV
jgi:hypothetical protein